MVFAFCIVSAWTSPNPSSATKQVNADARDSVFKNGLEKISAGSVEDSLTACLARIPEDASDDQRVLSVDTCKQEEVIRMLNHMDF